MPHKSETKIVGTYPTEEKAIEQLNDAVFDYYEKRTEYLPSSVGVSRDRKVFNIQIKINGSPKTLFRSKNLEEVLEVRKSIINQITY